MRKTVTLDDDLAEMLEREVKCSGESRKSTINRLLLEGLKVSLNPRSEENPEASEGVSVRLAAHPEKVKT